MKSLLLGIIYLIGSELIGAKALGDLSLMLLSFTSVSSSKVLVTEARLLDFFISTALDYSDYPANNAIFYSCLDKFFTCLAVRP